MGRVGCACSVGGISHLAFSILHCDRCAGVGLSVGLAKLMASKMNGIYDAVR